MQGYLKFTAAVLSFATLTACYVRVKEDGFEETNPIPSYPDVTIPSTIYVSLADRARACEAYDNAGTLNSGEWKNGMCYVDKNEDYKWRVSCPTSDCQALPIYVHYLLPEDLGQNNIVYVEAFTNAFFSGQPAGSARIGSFSADKPGEHQKVDLYLAPGEYYLRAYISNDEQQVVPYVYQNMEVVTNKPTGIYGALSSPKSVLVKPRSVERWPTPVDLYLDKLFKKPTASEPTNANLRVRLTLAEGVEVQDGRQVMISFLEDTDLAKMPVAEFKMASESLLVEGRKGKAEFVATNLNPGEYIVFSYIDANSNGFHDSDEASQIFTKEGQPAKVKLEKNRTETIDLQLSIAE